MVNMGTFSFSGLDSDFTGAFSDDSPLVTGNFSSSSSSSSSSKKDDKKTDSSSSSSSSTNTKKDTDDFDWTPNLQYTSFVDNIAMTLGFKDKTPGYWADSVITAFNNEGAEAAINKVNYLNQSGINLSLIHI